ncbi:MAG: GlxA family transcriptional regulator, partial [Rhodospirillaceae bacterium]|nr:GlxA family transcriptional regulator [Rhodospirillaceae bacterium]
GGHRHKTPAVLSWLRERHARGTRVGATSTGSWLLARSGLLHGRRCTVHWEDLDAFRETFPDLRVTSEIFEVDGRIFTCSGGTSIIDLMLSFVATRHGADLATAGSEQLIHGPYRSKSTNQRPGIDERIGITDPMLVKAVATMEAELHSPLPVAQIAKMTGVSSRHLERLFRKHLGQTPQLFYRELRLRQARSLLRSSDLPVSDVAYSLGFSTPSYFAKCYFELFGLLPRDERSRLPLFEVIE